MYSVLSTFDVRCLFVPSLLRRMATALTQNGPLLFEGKVADVTATGQIIVDNLSFSVVRLGHSLPHKVNRNRPQLEPHNRPSANGANTGLALFL